MRLCVVVLIFTCVAYTYADTGVPYSRTGTLLTSFTVPLTLQEANLGSETCRNNCSVASACRAWSYFRNETMCAPPGQRGLCRMFTTIGGTTSDPCSLSGVNAPVIRVNNTEHTRYQWGSLVIFFESKGLIEPDKARIVVTGPAGANVTCETALPFTGTGVDWESTSCVVKLGAGYADGTQLTAHFYYNDTSSGTVSPPTSVMIGTVKIPKLGMSFWTISSSSARRIDSNGTSVNTTCPSTAISTVRHVGGDGMIYFMTIGSNPKIYVMDPVTGACIRNYTTGVPWAAIGQHVAHSFANGMIYTSAGGKVQVIDPKTEERNTLHSPTNAVAVLTTHNDRVYFTTQNPNATDIYGHKMYSFSVWNPQDLLEGAAFGQGPYGDRNQNVLVNGPCMNGLGICGTSANQFTMQYLFNGNDTEYLLDSYHPTLNGNVGHITSHWSLPNVAVTDQSSTPYRFWEFGPTTYLVYYSRPRRTYNYLGDLTIGDPLSGSGMVLFYQPPTIFPASTTGCHLRATFLVEPWVHSYSVEGSPGFAAGDTFVTLHTATYSGSTSGPITSPGFGCTNYVRYRIKYTNSAGAEGTSLYIPFSCCVIETNPCGTPPGPNATCVDGQWVFPVVITGNIFVEKDDTVTIVEDTFVQGDLVVTGKISLPSSVTVDIVGDVVLEETSQIVIQLDTLADFQLKRNTQATNSTLLRIDGNLAVPNDVNAQIGLSDISAGLNISVVVATFTGSFIGTTPGVNIESSNPCVIVAGAAVGVQPNSLTLLFHVEPSLAPECATPQEADDLEAQIIIPWWGYLIIAIGVALIITAILLIAFRTRLANKVRPYHNT